MRRIIHRPTATLRRVAGQRGAVVHFMQCIKSNGETFYWADESECMMVPKDATSWDIRVALFTLKIQNERAAEAARKTETHG